MAQRATGGTDAFGRILGARLTELWGQQVIIDNRGGAQGNIGTALGARAAPDGFTLTLAHQGALTMVHQLFTNPGAAQDVYVFRFASDVGADQTTEIDRMRSMLAPSTEGRP